MSLSNKALQSINSLDFDTIKSELINYLSSQEKFKDYNFSGSGMSILLDILSYNTHHMGFYANMLANESFLDSCILRSSGVSLSKSIGYIPRSRRGADISVDVRMINTKNNPIDPLIVSRVKSGNYKVLKNEVFSAQKGGETYYFYSVNNVFFAYEGEDDNGPIIYARNVLLREGIINTRSFVVNNNFGLDQRFIIPDTNLDDRSVSVFVRKSITESEGSFEKWVRSSTIIENDPESKVFYLQEVYDGNYEIYFGDGIIGKTIDQGNIILVTYASCSGLEGNDIGITDNPINPNFNYITSIDTSTDDQKDLGFLTSIVLNDEQTPITSYGGQEKENLNSIKYYAPRFYETQDRAVTTNDYISFFQKEYSGSVRSIHVWGGEENDPPDYGKVYVSVRPNNSLYLNNQEKLALESTILTEKNIITITPKIVDPDYLFLTPEIRVKYDLRNSSVEFSELQSIVNNYVQIFGLNNLSLFEKNFFSGQLIRNIISLDNSIKSCTVDLSFNKVLRPVFNTSVSYSFSFENPLERLDFDRYIESDSFLTYGNSPNALSLPAVRAFFRDNGQGKVTLYDSATQEIIKNNFGTINYETGKVVLGPVTILLESGLNEYEIRIKAKPKDDDVFSKRNTILEMNYDEVSLELIEASTVRI